ncbi:MAG: nucleotidyltransferase domain-containing protein [Candidatus Nanoarchaeia archaeon]|nr:nucleotidyltransferase domain-containing protein [Candidatus Nanoarchaeia archaeon]
MLKLINNLKMFFEDCYEGINVRKYARLMKISPPTASKLLNDYYNQGLLRRQKDLGYLFFYANPESKNFLDLSRIYWRIKLNDLIEWLQKLLTRPAGILFGSLAKGEAKKDSDVDIWLFSQFNKREIDLKKFEKKLGRKISLFQSRSLETIDNKPLRNNVVNGYLLFGRLKW